MKLGSTQQLDKLPGLGSMFEQPAKLEGDQFAFIFWQFLTCSLWATLGMLAVQEIPLPEVHLLLLVAAPFVLMQFSLVFHRHYLYLCTGGLNPQWRTEVRMVSKDWPFAFFVLFPVALPWMLCSLFRNFSELRRAWVSWLCYNRQGDIAPGILISPAGSQPKRVWLFRLTVFLVAAGTLYTPWPALESLSSAGQYGVLALVILVHTPGLLVIVVTSLLTAPFLQSLKEHRSVP